MNKQSNNFKDRLGGVLFKFKDRGNRKYKDSLFRMIFGENKENLLSLYNALNGSSYDDTSKLTINTLKNAIYMNVKNDISFVLFDEILLYEQQSTVNPNMGLRFLYYVSDLLQMTTVEGNIYGRSALKIPEPKFVVFYNGTEEMPERFEHKLSDLYEKKSDEPELELVVQVLNINFGFNEDIKSVCKTLGDYTIFIEKVRENQKTMPLEEAIRKASLYCIEHDILREFLERSEAQMLGHGVLYEFDEKKQRRLDYRDGYREGMMDERKKNEARIANIASVLHRKDTALAEKDKKLVEKDREIEKLKAENERLKRG